MWCDRYLNIPYKHGGRDKKGIDCWGLIVLIFSKELHITLTSGLDEYKEILTKEKIQQILSRESKAWDTVKTPKEFDVVLIRIGGFRAHVGLMVKNNLMLHITKGSNVVLEYINTTKWKSRIVGFFRYV